MCGVSFYFSKERSFKSDLIDSLDSMRHRGPDASNIYCEEMLHGYVGVGHNRLSIIDTSSLGEQPLSRLGATISYNGEIYNYIEIRQDLECRGYSFKSNTDTEVILIAYIEYGIACFNMFKGMFAFVILDHERNKVHIVRDTVGIKPIYIYRENSALFASSEIRGLKSLSIVDTKISEHDIFEFFNNGFLYEPATGFQNIKKLLPGHYLTLDLESNILEFTKFSDIFNFKSDISLYEKISQSVELQQNADVPAGVFFSGGLDSSIIAAFSKNLSLFFINHDNSPHAKFDLKYSTLISKFLNLDLTTESIKNTEITTKEMLQSFHFVADNTEELISDYTFWSTYKLSKSAKLHGYTVMLSGMGGDEGYAGYPRYLILKNHNLIIFFAPIFKLMNYFKLIPKSLSKKFERLLSYIDEKNWAIGYSRLLGYFSTSDLKSLFKRFDILNPVFIKKLDSIKDSYKGENDKVKIAQHYDLTGFLSHNLTVADKASMLASIELRVPFLDECILCHGLGSKSKKLIFGKKLKYPLRKILLSLLPRKLVDRPKTGFNPPLDGIINSIGQAEILKELESLSEILDIHTIKQIVNTHFSGKNNHTYKIWQLMYFSRWMRNNY